MVRSLIKSGGVAGQSKLPLFLNGPSELNTRMNLSNEKIFPTMLGQLPFGPIWLQLPDLSTQGTVDPFVFRERLAIYQFLIEHTGTREVVGSFGERHIFWGYASQLYWQWETGRLASEPDAERITPTSWWGWLNYTLSVIPLLAALRGGFAPRLEVVREPSLTVGESANFEEPLRLWEHFFAALSTAAAGSDLEPVRFHSWTAHLASINTGLRQFSREFAQLSQMEQRFAHGWTRMVDFLGAAAARTDLEALLELGDGTLPTRQLRNEDRPGAIPDMSPAVNKTVRDIVALGDRPAWRFAWDRWIWRRAMRAADLRAEANEILFGDKGKDPAIQKRLWRAALWPLF